MPCLLGGPRNELSGRGNIIPVAAWIFGVCALTLMLIPVALETETVPASGKRIALMLIPAAIALLLGASATGVRPVPLAVGIFALTWTLLSGFHPGRIWREPGAPGRHRAFVAPWIAITVGVAVMLLTIPEA